MRGMEHGWIDMMTLRTSAGSLVSSCCCGYAMWSPVDHVNQLSLFLFIMLCFWFQTSVTSWGDKW